MKIYFFSLIFLNYIIKISIITIFQIIKRKLYQLNSCNLKMYTQTLPNRSNLNNH